MFLYAVPECVKCACGCTPAIYHFAGKHGVICLNEACVFSKIELDAYVDESSAIQAWNEAMSERA